MRGNLIIGTIRILVLLSLAIGLGGIDSLTTTAAPPVQENSGGTICMWQTVEGEISSAVPENNWLFNVDNAASVQIEASTDESSNLDPVVTLYLDDTGGVVEALTDFPNPRERTRIMNFALPQPGVYRINIKGIAATGPGSSGTYALTLEQGLSQDVLNAALTISEMTGSSVLQEFAG
jgi:hypothetical protein